MRPQGFKEPQLLVAKAQELSISGPALLELMRAVLDKGVSFRFCARGWSMAPFVRDGDIITVSPLSQVSPRVGEVVAFVHPSTGTLVVHRVVAMRGIALFIQGDSLSECADGFVPSENLLGRVTQVERQGRNVALGLGPERFLIAWLSRTGRLVPLRGCLASWLKPVLRR